MKISKKAPKRVTAGEEIDVEVSEEATELVLEAEDAAELIAEVVADVTEAPVEVEVEADADFIEFTVNDTTYTVEPEGEEELLEASTRTKKTPVKASSKVVKRRPRARR